MAQHRGCLSGDRSYKPTQRQRARHPTGRGLATSDTFVPREWRFAGFRTLRVPNVHESKRYARAREENAQRFLSGVVVSARDARMLASA